MDALLIYGLIIIFIFILFTISFIIIYLSNKELRTALWWSIALISGISNIIFDIITDVISNHFTLGLLGASYFMTSIILLGACNILTRSWFQKSRIIVLEVICLIFYTTLSFLITEFSTLSANAIVNAIMLIVYLSAIIAMIYHQFMIVIKSKNILSIMTLILYFPFLILIGLGLENQISRIIVDSSIFPLEMIYAMFIVVIVGLCIAWSLTILCEFIDILKVKAEIDPLTLISNRRHFFEISASIIEKVTKEKKSICFIMFDIDNFKSVNDTYGHSIGDLALKHVTSVINGKLTSNMLFARLGGEEFCILIHHESQFNIKHFSEKLRLSLEATPMITNCCDSIAITASFGTVCCKMEQHTIDHIMNLADQAMYCAKKSGKNKVVNFEMK